MHEVFQTQRIEHAFLEPESSLAVPSGDDAARRLHVYWAGQGVWDDRDDICRVLAVDTDVVTVEPVSNGGALGGKEDMATSRTSRSPPGCSIGREVHAVAEESFRIHAKRHPVRLEYWAAVTPTACSRPCDSRRRPGAYALVGMKVLEAPLVTPPGRTTSRPSTWSRSPPHQQPVVRRVSWVRANQAQFAMDGVMDRLAAAVGIQMEMRATSSVQALPGARGR